MHPRLVWKPGDFQAWDHEDTVHTSIDTDLNKRINRGRQVIASPSMIQLARYRLRKAFDEAKEVDRVDGSVISHRGR